jgi:hypothetical protein
MKRLPTEVEFSERIFGGGHLGRWFRRIHLNITQMQDKPL